MVMLEIERNLPEGQYSKISACCIAVPKVYIYIFDNKICCISRRGDSEQSEHGGGKWCGSWLPPRKLYVVFVAPSLVFVNAA